MRTKLLIITSLLSLNCFAAEVVPNAVYGDDNRVESLQYNNPMFVEKAKSIAGAVYHKALREDPRNPDMLDFDKYALKDELALCDGEKFGNQNMLMGCSGFLIDNNRILTASHCVMDQDDCDNYKWVFDYYDDSEQIKKENVFSCKKIIKSKYKVSNSRYYDYAIIELDRAVPGRSPLEYRKKEKPNHFSRDNRNKRPNIATGGTKVVIIGHPMGLPMKTADDARIALLTKTDVDFFADDDSLSFFDVLKRLLTHGNYIFRTNLDSFQANSGAPVFNKKTGVVEGILVEGGLDYELTDLYGNGTKFCRKAVKYSHKMWHSEEVVMRTTAIKELQ